jgi:hypothetical protein
VGVLSLGFKILEVLISLNILLYTYIDSSKAFDRVRHFVLLEKFSVDIEPAYDWGHIFLVRTETQCIRIGFSGIFWLCLGGLFSSTFYNADDVRLFLPVRGFSEIYLKIQFFFFFFLKNFRCISFQRSSKLMTKGNIKHINLNRLTAWCEELVFCLYSIFHETCCPLLLRNIKHPRLKFFKRLKTKVSKNDI